MQNSPKGGYSEAMSFFLEHPDFSLVPNPDTPATWRGVAKTQEGIKTLLALWGVPSEDPDHPFCVFSWTPTPCALKALHAHAPETQALPCVSPCAPWEAQKDRAWLTAPSAPFVFRCPVIAETPWGNEPGFLDVHGTPGLFDNGRAPPLLFWERPDGARSDCGLFGGTTAVFLWDTEKSRLMTSQCDFQLSPSSGKALRAAILSCVQDPHPTGRWFPTLLGTAYACAGTQAPASDFFSETAPWAQPLFERTVRAFFEREEGASSKSPWRITPAHYREVRAIAQEYDLAQQTAAWGRIRGLYSVEACVCSPVAHVHALLGTLGDHDHSNDRLNRNPLKKGVHWALMTEDTAFFEALASVSDKDSQPFDVRSLLPEETQAQWDRHWGFRARDTSEGLLRFAASLGETAWKAPMSQSLSPAMRREMNDPAFLGALARTGFWGCLEKASDRHPEWEALLERHLLQTLTAKPPAQHRFPLFLG
jgi:hypothetical protein